LRKAAPEPHVPGVKPRPRAVLALLAVSTLGLGFAPSGLSSRLDDDDPGDSPDASEPDASAPEAAPPDDAGAAPNAPFPKCIDVHAYARYGAGAYDHIVRIDNGCDKDASCEIATDVSPEVITTDVPSKDYRELVTYRGSPSTEFHARVKCDLHD
jgi:hypothetical protein